MQKIRYVICPLRLVCLGFLCAVFLAGEAGSSELRQHGFYDIPLPFPCSSAMKHKQEPEQVVEKLRKLCEQAKNSQQKPQQSHLLNIRNQLTAAAFELEMQLMFHPDTDAVKQWKTDLKLDELRSFLAGSTPAPAPEKKNGNGEPDPLQIVKDAYQEIHDPHRGYHAEIFVPLTNLLRQYLTYENAVKNEKFLDEYVQYCEEIPKFVESYLSEEHPEYAPALSRATLWLSDLALCMDSAKRISSYLKQVLGHPNLYVHVSSNFLSHAFQRSISEPLDVNECVIDMRMRGSGTVRGETKMSFQNNENQAQFLLRLHSQVLTNTYGVKGPARVSTRNNSSNVSELSIFFTPDGVFSDSARSRVNLSSQTTGLAVKAPPLFTPLVCTVAQNQVQKRKPRYEAASRQLLERRLNERFNEQVRENLAEINKRYKDEFQRPLKESGFYPRTLEFQTDPQTLLVSAALAGEAQPCSGNAAGNTFAAVQKWVDAEKADITVQIHQSAFNNMLNQLLSGERMDEAAFCNMIQKRFPNLLERVQQFIPKSKNGDEDDPPLALTFAEQSPVRVTFADQTLTVVLQIDTFEEEETTYPGLDITVRFRVRVENDESGLCKNTGQIVFEKLETTAFPPGFDPEGKAKLNTREQIIRNVVLKRLEKRLEPSYQLDSLELGEQWKDKGKLTPASAFVDKGWLTLFWVFR